MGILLSITFEDKVIQILTVNQPFPFKKEKQVKTTSYLKITGLV